MLGTLATALTLRLRVSLGSVAGSCNPFAMKGGNGGPLVRRAVTRVTLGRRVKVPLWDYPVLKGGLPPSKTFRL